MKIKSLIFVLFLSLLVGCNSSDTKESIEGSSSSLSLSSSASSIAINIENTPQPKVEDASMRPPRAPSL